MIQIKININTVLLQIYKVRRVAGLTKKSNASDNTSGSHRQSVYEYAPM